MGMKKQSQGLSTDSGLPDLPAVPPVPSLPRTSVAPKADPNGVSPVAPTVVQAQNNGDTGLGKVLKGDMMSKQEWRDKDERISIDAIHKSTLESPTLANLAIGKNDGEVFDLIKRFLKFNLELNQLAKRGDL